VRKCDAFLERFGGRPAVARVLQRIQTTPGRSLFTSPETISELERIVGAAVRLRKSSVATEIEHFSI
jgi:hypothetical protein